MDKNLSTYNSLPLLNWYKQLIALTPVESKLFEIHKDRLSQASVLDIGVGGGRTTRYLFPKCKNYIGIDYSEVFITSLKKDHPKLDLRIMDARDLSAFDSGSFDLVNFSFNGIDYVDLDGREKILSEVNRVLKPNGLFFFSTHNRHHSSFNKYPWLHSENNLLTNVKTFLKSAPFLYRKIKNKNNELFKKEFALINDSAHNYQLITFYSSPDFLVEQLLSSGFEEPDLYNKAGNKVRKEMLDDWIFVSTKKSIV
jgi:SAM-dependent methyltransferase